MRVPLLIVVVGDDHLRPGAPDDRRPAGRSPRRCRPGRSSRDRRWPRTRPSRVAVAEHHDLVEADRRRRRRQLGRAHAGDERLLVLRAQPVERLAGLAQRGVLEFALLAAGATHEHGADALGVVLGERRRALRGLVVGVRVDGEDRPGVGHAVTISAVVRARRTCCPRPSSVGSPACSWAPGDRSDASLVALAALAARRHRLQRRRPRHARPRCCRPRRAPPRRRRRCRPARRRSITAPRDHAASVLPARDGLAERGRIPARHTCDDPDVAPALSWTTVPVDTVELAVTMVDLDADFTHWVMFGISPTRTGLAEDEVPPGAIQWPQRLRRRRLRRAVPARPATPTPTCSRCTRSTSRSKLPMTLHATEVLTCSIRRHPPELGVGHVRPSRLT